MVSSGKRPPLREELSLFQSTVAREGTTTGAGNVAGNTIIDAGLIGVGANSFISMLIILYPGDFNLVDSADITVFNNANGEITFDHPYKNVAAAIPAGVRYKIVTFRFVPAEVAALVALVTALMADVGDPTGETLASLAAKWGDIARSLDLILGARWDAAGDLGTDIAAMLTELGRATLFKDQWCATPIASVAITAVGADLVFPNVVFPAGFLPAGAVIQAVYPMFKWRKMVDSSSAPNMIIVGGDGIRVMKTGAGWAASTMGIATVVNQWHTAADATEGGDMIVGNVDVKARVDDVDNETYEVRSEETTNGDAITVTAASLTLHDIYTGLRVYYTLV